MATLADLTEGIVGGSSFIKVAMAIAVKAAANMDTELAFDVGQICGTERLVDFVD